MFYSTEVFDIGVDEIDERCAVNNIGNADCDASSCAGSSNVSVIFNFDRSILNLLNGNNPVFSKAVTACVLVKYLPLSYKTFNKLGK